MLNYRHVRERLLIVGVACALVLGGWAGVFAAVVCPHAGVASRGEASHDCCRGGDGGDAAACPMKFGESGGVRHQPESDDSHGAAHGSHEQTRAVAVEERAPDARRVGAFGVRSVFCAHCVGSRLPPPSSTRLSAPEAARRGDACAPARALKLPEPSPPVFVREVIPSQGSPPGAAPLYVLNSVFLI